MALTARFLQPIISRASSSSSSIASTRSCLFYAKCQPLNSWMKTTTKRIQTSSAVQIRPQTSLWRLCAQRYLDLPNFSKSRREVSMGSMISVSVVLGTVGLWPRTAYCMNGLDFVVDDNQAGLLGTSDSREDPRSFLIFLRKLLVPVTLFLIVVNNLSQPMLLAAKVILILLSTKPSPLSVYISIEQMQRQFKNQHPILYKFRSLYANKVEVEDYTLFCVARVQLNNQNFTLVGVLGSWWVFQSTTCQEAFSAIWERAISNSRLYI